MFQKILALGCFSFIRQNMGPENRSNAKSLFWTLTFVRQEMNKLKDLSNVAALF